MLRLHLVFRLISLSRHFSLFLQERYQEELREVQFSQSSASHDGVEEGNKRDLPMAEKYKLFAKVSRLGSNKKKGSCTFGLGSVACTLNSNHCSDSPSSASSSGVNLDEYNRVCSQVQSLTAENQEVKSELQMLKVENQYFKRHLESR